MENKEKFDLFESIEMTDHEKIMVDIAENVSEIIFNLIRKRIELNLTQRDLAELCGIKQPMIARIESLKTIPRLDTLVIIAKSLDLDIMAINNYLEMVELNINVNLIIQEQSYEKDNYIFVNDKYMEGEMYAI